MNGYRCVCNYCGATEEEVGHMIVAKDKSAGICDSCVFEAATAIDEVNGELEAEFDDEDNERYTGLLH